MFYIYITFFIYSYNDGCLVNSLKLKNVISLGYIDFIYYRYIPSRRITKFYGSNNFSFKNLSHKSAVASHFSKLSFSNGEMS